MPVSMLVTENVARIASDATVVDVARALTDAEVGVLAVFVGDDVKGIVSERDVTHAIAAGQDPATTTAIDIAHTDLVWCDPTSTVAEVATEMMENYVRHVLVGDAGTLAGIVSARDLLGAYAAGDLAELSPDASLSDSLTD